MRRTDRQVNDFSEICAILDSCQVMRIGLCDGQRPYVVPVNFGYEVRQGQIWLYFHCANQGRKLDILKRNPSVCFEMDCEHDLVLDPTPCACGYRFASVIGEGTAEILTAHQEKAHGLSVLMTHLTGRQVDFTPEQTTAVCVCRIIADTFTAKRRA